MHAVSPRIFGKIIIFLMLLAIPLYSTAISSQAQSCTKKTQGDANCDGAVDLLDFEQFRQEFIAARDETLIISTAKANFNGDSSVDLLDFEVFRVGYIASQTTATPTATIRPTASVSPTQTTSPTIISQGCVPPYSANSPWNTPISNPVYDPNSASYASGFGTIGSNVSSFTMAVYEANRSTPIKTANVSGVFSRVVDDTSITKSSGSFQVPIPSGAAPASGSDSQVIIWNRDTGEEWGFWQVSMTSSGLSAVNGYYYKTTWDGVPPKGFGSRGAGVPYFTGLIRPCEIRQGHIDHAIAFAYDKVSSSYVYPATKSDGGGSGVPEGARMQLDPSISDATIKGWGCDGTCFVIAKALQKYGMIAIDYAGHSKIYGEYQGSAHWNATEWNDKIISKIPSSQFKVLKLQ